MMMIGKTAWGQDVENWIVDGRAIGEVRWRVIRSDGDAVIVAFCVVHDGNVTDFICETRKWQLIDSEAE